MKPTERDEGEAELVSEYVLDAAPETVWKALMTSALRDRWLPAADLADRHPTAVEPGRRISFAMRESEPPYVESVVTFDLQPCESGGTRFRIVHSVATPGSGRVLMAANGNRRPARMAA